MITFDELTEQNQKIAELAKVVVYLINDRSICDTQTTCDLFFDFLARVKSHLDVEERELYQELLTHRDNDVKMTANKFLSGSSEIKRVFKEYTKRWCKNKQLRIKDHEVFIKETDEMCELVMDRIIDETEHFYPIVRQVYGTRMAA